MYGLITRSIEDVGDERFERVFFVTKDVSGRKRVPTSTGINMISCHGDATAADSAKLCSISESGERATREQPYFDWSYVCPTHPEYREELLTFVAKCARVGADIRLDDVGFARGEYCHCQRCNRQFVESEFSDRSQWRVHVISDFLTEARERVPGRLYVTLYPDPNPGHLYVRNGVDLEAIEHLVDEWIVPLYDLAYATTYWLETIASGFADRLPADFAIELYALEVERDNLIHASEVADAYADHVYFSYDSDTAKTVIDRLTDGNP